MARQTMEPRLFGTSGIRGTARVDDTPPASVVRAFTDDGVLHVKLVFNLGRALARFLARISVTEVALGIDPRPSSPAFARALGHGLSVEGIQPAYCGVCPTPTAALFPQSCFAMITASHNNHLQNGVKIFLEGIPLAAAAEDELESYLRLLEAEPVNCCFTAKFCDIGPSIGQRFVQRYRRAIDNADLANWLPGSVLPLDLAFGAAAAPPHGLSPQLATLLDAGVAIVGYGTEQDGHRVNVCVGAAYPYGECRLAVAGGTLAVSPKPEELMCLAEGAHGYGAAVQPPISRSIYLPQKHAFKHGELRAEATLIDGHWCFFDVDGTQEELRPRLEDELAVLRLLPALSQDCDADRILLTDPQIARRPEPFLSGDLLLLLFAHFLEPRHVIFTVESGLDVEKYLEARGIPFGVVTVGDRAVAQGLRALPPHQLEAAIGGEPSGHLLLAAAHEGRLVLEDDPFLIYIQLLGLLRQRDCTLGDLVEVVRARWTPAYTARKPEAWAVDKEHQGITLREKLTLQLRAEPGGPTLGSYAAAFVPHCMELFAKCYVEAFYGDDELGLSTIVDDVFISHVEGKPFDQQGREWIKVGQISIIRQEQRVEELEVSLRVSDEPHLGPNDIHLAFFAKDRGNWTKTGEVVTRNSGTSPKNSGYIKLFPWHYPSSTGVTDGQIRKVTQQLAQQRVDFTEGYIRAWRRSLTRPIA